MGFHDEYYYAWGIEGVIQYLPNGGSLAINENVNKILQPNSIDIIMTNPPFGSDFSDLDSLKQYTIGNGKSSRRRGVLFVERAIQLLKPGGRLAIILDESVLNGISNSDIRRFIINETNIQAVISLPNVTFLPYSSAKSSILFLEKKRKFDEINDNKEIFMANVENIGKRPNGDPRYRNERDERGRLVLDNDLPNIVQAWKKFKQFGKEAISDLSPFIFICNTKEFINERGEIVNNRLDIQFHHPTKIIARDILKKSIYPIPKLAELVVVRNKMILPKIDFSDETCRLIGLANITPNTGEYFVSEVFGEKIKSSVRYFRGGDILFARLRPELKKCIFIEDFQDDGFTSSECFVFRALDRAKDDNELKNNIINTKKSFEIDSEYLAYMLRSDIVYGQIVYQITGVGRPRISKSTILNVRIPVPPINEQKEIIRQFKESSKRCAQLKNQSQKALIEADNVIHDVYNFVQNKLCPTHFQVL